MVINVKEYFSDIWDGCRAQPNEQFSSGATNQKNRPNIFWQVHLVTLHMTM